MRSLPTHRTRSVLLGAAGVLVVLAVLYRFPPSVSTFYPQCPIWTLLHVRCPGCGGTRALAALLHGDIAGALRWNALAVFALPAALSWAVVRSLRSGRQVALRDLRPPTTAIVAGLLLAAGFTLIRNL